MQDGCRDGVIAEVGWLQGCRVIALMQGGCRVAAGFQNGCRAADELQGCRVAAGME